MNQKRNTAKNIKKSKQDFSAINGLLIFCITISVFLSLLSFSYGPTTHNWVGFIGYSIGHFGHALLGVGSYVACIYVGWIGWRRLFHKSINRPVIKALYIFIFIASLCILLSLIEDKLPSAGKSLGQLFYPNAYSKKLFFHLGGTLFYYIYHDIPVINLLHILNTAGIILLFSTSLIISVLLITKTSPRTILDWIKGLYKAIWKKDETEDFLGEEPPAEHQNMERLVTLRIPTAQQGGQSLEGKSVTVHHGHEFLAIQPETHLTERPSLSHKANLDRNREKEEKKETPPVPTPRSKRQTAIDAQKVHNGDFQKFSLPSPSLLTNPKKVDSSSLKKDLRRQAEVLEETLQSFGIEAKVGQINCGPAITSFEVHPSIGVKVQKIKALENDIALNMEAKSIRIIAPIPGKAAVGIEVPNAHPQEVSFKEMLVAYQQGSRKFHIPVLLGKAVNGDYVMNDLTKMPHCIIAGATGSGKSVCINTIVMAILMNARPDEIKLIMVDPKKVELTPYTRLPHLLAPVITEPQGACAALHWLVKEMESRYEILKQLGVRNIEAFNTRTINKTLEASLEKEIPARLPYIVVIIDELADLMMVASNDIETPIARIAQMARAVGIHMILATQRPSREVITGLIKANFPTRIAFKVASRVNSQIILDEIGAESLLGNGDMLFLPPGTSINVRAQGAFIRDEDIAAAVKHICDQAPPNYVIASFDALGRENASAAEEKESTNDSLYDQAASIVLSTGNASTTFLQRKLKIGYARAASLIDELESKGVVGSAEGGKSRKVLVAAEEKNVEE